MPTSINLSVNKKSGFTLIELLVVITIIAILAVIGFSVFGGAAAKAKDAKRRSDIDAIVKAFETNYDPIKGTYSKIGPEDFTGNKIPTPPEKDGVYEGIAIAASDTNSFKGVAICAKLEARLSSVNKDLPCSKGSSDCYCKDLSQGEIPEDNAFQPLTDPSGTSLVLTGSAAIAVVGDTGGGVGSESGTGVGGTQSCIGCSADINGDGTVNGTDYNLFSACNGKTTSDAGCKYVDLNADTLINGADFTLFQSQNGQTIQKNLACENFGDLDSNSKLNISDVRQLKENIASLGADNRKKYIADVDNDGTGGNVEESDAALLQRYVEGTDPVLPACDNMKDPPSSCGNTGDVTTDGKVTRMDMAETHLLISRFPDSIYTNQPYTQVQTTSADNNRDGEVSVDDVQRLGRYLQGLRTDFPACFVSFDYKRVFVTSSLHVGGSIGGLSGADAICKNAAANLGGRWMAWLSAGTTSPVNRFSTKATVPYKWVDGVTEIANNWNYIITHTSLMSPINMSETKATFSNAEEDFWVWTNTNYDGTTTSFSDHCDNWSSATGRGYTGILLQEDATWTESGIDLDCNHTRGRLYCFEQ